MQSEVPSHVDRLYMDCNSILYDVFHAWTKQGSESSIEESEDQIIGRVIEKIQFYVRLVQPQHLVYVAFDGVAPRAKMNQQRQRRYKSEYMKQIQGSEMVTESIGGNASQETVAGETTKETRRSFGLSTTMFTPGTRFMQKLTVQLKRTLASLHRYIVSASDEPGEGEHKITQHMRDTADASHVVAWYGLDSDLIMLSILHCRRFHHVYLFRETPAKPPSHGKTQSPVEEEILYMNIPLLVRSIYIEIMQKEPEEDGKTVEVWSRVYDYVFLCFFLGNDFLPHFPALNLRTHGIQVLVDTYRAHVVPTRRFLVDVTAGAIQWKQVYVLVSALARIEPILWNKEYEHREKLAKRTQMDVEAYTSLLPQAMCRVDKVDSTKLRSEASSPQKSRRSLCDFQVGTDKVGSGPKGTGLRPASLWSSRSSNLADPNSFERMPVLFRGKELYISPRDAGWESRYYRALFPDVGVVTDRREVSCNYLEALEWVFTYYVSGCSHWHWHYRYEYPPLLSDLVRYVPHFDTRFLPIPTVLDTTPATCTEQLYIVLPPSQHHLIPNSVASDPPLDAKSDGSEARRSVDSEIASDFQVSAALPLINFGRNAGEPTKEVRRSLDETPIRATEFEWSFCTYFWESHLVHIP
jgi:5'-3' exoribonuclease 2